MARFGQALKPSKVPQQLSKASAPHNPPLALPSYLPIGPSNCFYWASKLLHGTFWPGLKSPKSSAAAFESLRTAQPSACFAIVYLPIGPSNCFYSASKLLHGTFWPGLLLGSLSTAQPSACFAIVPPHRPYKLFLLGFETATWHVLARPSFGKPQHRTTLRLLCHRTSPIGPTNCFYTFWPGLLLGSLSTAQPSACFAIVPPHRPYKLFLLGFETATWHVLARP